MKTQYNGKIVPVQVLLTGTHSTLVRVLVDSPDQVNPVFWQAKAKLTR